jgi:hypothetical protein
MAQVIITVAFWGLMAALFVRAIIRTCEVSA